MAGREWGCCHCTIGGLTPGHVIHVLWDAEDSGRGEDSWFYRKERDKYSIGKSKIKIKINRG